MVAVVAVAVVAVVVVLVRVVAALDFLRVVDKWVLVLV